jgi:hypothetical protein
MNMSAYRLGALCLPVFLAGLVVSCRNSESDPPQSTSAVAPWFLDITEKSGIRFIHDAGPTGSWFMPQIMGSGAALFDFDNDGRLDIYLIHNGGPSGKKNQLYHQEKDGTFKDVSAGSGLDVAGFGMGVAVGDVNNDGLPDVLLTEYGKIRLFLNNGNGTFKDVTKESGLENNLWGTSAAFFDYDRDGWLDLIVVNYVEYDHARECLNSGERDFCGPNVFKGTVAKLFRNQGQAGTPLFEDVTLKSGLSRKPGPGLGVVCADFNGDGWPDIFIANDSKANHLWINQRNGTFTEEAEARNVAYNGYGQMLGNMGVTIGDVAGSGLFDLFVTHLTDESNTLWRQESRGLFKDGTVAARLAIPGWRGTGFGTVLADFDHDGWPDLALVNGRVLRGSVQNDGGLDPFWAKFAERNQLFANDGSGRFVDLSPTDPFSQPPGVSRGLACGDIDGDGALDLLVTTVAGPARLYRNVAPKQGHWLMIRAIDPARRRDAYGAVITVHAGGRRWLGFINPGQSYLCSNDPRAHFGLGELDHVDSIHVQWPDGDAAEEIFLGGKTDRLIVLHRGEGVIAPTPK